MPQNFNVPGPNLEHLSVIGTRLSRTRGLFSGHMPKLRRFVLWATDITSFPVGLSELEELVLDHVYGMDNTYELLTVDSLHRILFMYPGLKRLTVHGIISYPPPPRPLHLPALETLTITSSNVASGFGALSVFSDLPSSKLQVTIRGIAGALDLSMWRLVVQWLHRAERLAITINEGAGFRFASLDGTVDICMHSGGSPFIIGMAATSTLLQNILIDAERSSPLHATIIISLKDRERTNPGGIIEEFLK
ncbi:hypothetical protein M407DRAFT_22153 [Tulasnella calospora MUT 4182]|uniref:F-box domain-containing protein n=1 Tax=Tulasnella calospora MUT 4182 TaxID=1051891 RepID=A0A0C3QNL6_9AGAM|nr:hypothetical protein M407DRAFT_22153 [Tulasnella calospora MUT 4182]